MGHREIPAEVLQKIAEAKGKKRGAILGEVDLSGVNLKGIDLRKADLIGANLRGANLEGADLSRAVLRNADLQVANLLEQTWNAPTSPGHAWRGRFSGRPGSGARTSGPLTSSWPISAARTW